MHAPAKLTPAAYALCTMKNLCIIWLAPTWFPAFSMHYRLLCITSSCIMRESTVGIFTELYTCQLETKLIHLLYGIKKKKYATHIATLINQARISRCSWRSLKTATESLRLQTGVLNKRQGSPGPWLNQTFERSWVTNQGC